MTDPDGLAEAQARGTADLAREVVGPVPTPRLLILELSDADGREFVDVVKEIGTEALRGVTIHAAIRESATAALDALAHPQPRARAVDRLIRNNRPEYNRLLAEERGRL